MFGLSIVRQRLKRFSPVLLRPASILSRKVSLVDKCSVADDYDPMGIRFLQALKPCADGADQFRVKCLLLGSCNCPTIAEAGGGATRGISARDGEAGQ